MLWMPAVDGTSVATPQLAWEPRDRYKRNARASMPGPHKQKCEFDATQRASACMWLTVGCARTVRCYVGRLGMLWDGPCPRHGPSARSAG